MGLLDLPTLTPGHSGTPVCPFTSINLGRFFSVQFETNLPDFVYQLLYPCNDLIKKYHTYEKNIASQLSPYFPKPKNLTKPFPYQPTSLDRTPHLPFIERSCPTHVRHIQDVKIANTGSRGWVGWVFTACFFRGETGNLIILLVG